MPTIVAHGLVSDLDPEANVHADWILRGNSERAHESLRTATADVCRVSCSVIVRRNAAFQYALKIVRKAEATGQAMLFDPRNIVKP